MYMDPPSTTGKAQIGSATLGAAMDSWSILDQFRDQAVQSVNLLVLAAIEGSYSAQAFIFDTQAGVSLTTLLVVTNKIDSPIDPTSPVEIANVTINSNTAINQ